MNTVWAVRRLARATGFEVVDWKTGNEVADPLQLAVYRLAWAEMNDLPVSAVSAAFLYVRTGTVERPGDLHDRAALTAILTGGALAGLSS
jgi:DNA helicase-2/ATP-dependent DNA helicase PcrA